jgi:hypothetical protein
MNSWLDEFSIELRVYGCCFGNLLFSYGIGRAGVWRRGVG